MSALREHLLATALLWLALSASDHANADTGAVEDAGATGRQSLPLGTVLDSQGKPLTLPSTQDSALDYSALEYSASELTPVKSGTKARSQSKQSSGKRSTNSRRKPLSAKDRLDSRRHVANDPGCRWLDNRLDHLEAAVGLKRQGQRQDTTHGYQAQELRVRREEWRCLKCAAEGPAQGDHANCQYRR